MRRLLGLIIVMISMSASADYGDSHNTTCTLFSNNKLSKIIPCMVEETGGAGRMQTFLCKPLKPVLA